MSVHEAPPPPAPQQERSRRSHARVLSVARDLVAREGLDGVVIAEVARLAGVAVGTIYNRFGDKTGLLRAVSDQEGGEVQQHIMAAIHAAEQVDDPSLRLEGAVRGIVNAFRQHADVMQKLFFLGATDPYIRIKGSMLTKPMATAFSNLVASSGANTKDLALKVDVCFRSVFAACVFRVTYGEDSESERRLSWKTFEDEMVRSSIAYVIGFTGGQPRGTTRSRRVEAPLPKAAAKVPRKQAR